MEWEWFRAATGSGIGARFETVADSIAIGCLLAGARPILQQTAWYPRLLASPFFVLVPILAILGNLTHDHPLVSFAVGMSLSNICVALCLDWAVTFHQGRIGRVLNAAPLVFVGWLSYSLYLWQQPFLNRASRRRGRRVPVEHHPDRRSRARVVLRGRTAIVAAAQSARTPAMDARRLRLSAGPSN